MYFMIHKHHTKTNQQPPPYSFAHDTRRSGTPPTSFYLLTRVYKIFRKFRKLYVHVSAAASTNWGSGGGSRDATNSSGLD
jgi:hypothetical protein